MSNIEEIPGIKTRIDDSTTTRRTIDDGATSQKSALKSFKRKLTQSIYHVYTWFQSIPFKAFLSFIGPGYMVAVGYMDPGNWATDFAAGSEFGYSLLFVILLSNIMAIFLQYLCIKLGVVTKRDLAENCRAHLNPYINILFYILCEVAIIATDLAEVIGTAIALKLLFNLPLTWGILLTGLDVLIILLGFQAKYLRYFEFFIAILVLTVAICFSLLLSKVGPDWTKAAYGYLPIITIFKNENALYLAMGIVGATVMPHNLYLHSNMVKFRSSREKNMFGKIITNEEELIKDSQKKLGTNNSTVITTHATNDIHATNHHENNNSNNGSVCVNDISRFNATNEHRTQDLKSTQNLLEEAQQVSSLIRFMNCDSMIAMTLALLINSAILITAAASLNKQGYVDVGDLELAHSLIVQYLGNSAGIIFAIALLCSGQSSTITGTLAGQIVMQGFLGNRFNLPAWLRRLITRSLAIVPALIVSLSIGDKGVGKLLVLSQVILSLQLPFAVWPLVLFTSNSKIMNIFDENTQDVYDLEELQEKTRPSETIPVTLENLQPPVPYLGTKQLSTHSAASLVTNEVIELNHSLHGHQANQSTSIKSSETRIQNNTVSICQNKKKNNPFNFSNSLFLKIVVFSIATLISGLNIYLLTQVGNAFNREGGGH